MACQLYRKNDKVDKVLAPNQEDSILYKDILKEVKKKGVAGYISAIPYLQYQLDNGKLLNDSPEEIAVGLWSIAYTPEYKAFFNNMKMSFPLSADINEEPVFSFFNNTVIKNEQKQYSKPVDVEVLTASKSEFLNKVNKKGNKLQQKITEALIKNPENPVVLEPDEHIYIDEDGEEYKSTTTAIKGKLENDAFELNRNYGTSIDLLLQNIILDKPFKEAIVGIDNINEEALKGIFNVLQAYVNSLRRDGSIIFTQFAVGDKASKIAGSLDLIVISPQGKIKIIDLKSSKNSVKTSNYDIPYNVKEGSVFVGEKLSTRQQHGIQVGVYKKLIELKGFRVDEVSTVHIKLNMDSNNEIKDIDWEDEINHPPSINRDFVNKVVPTELPGTNKINDFLKELGMDNPADDPNFLEEDELLPESEMYDQTLYEKITGEAIRVMDFLEAKRKYLEKISEGKTFYDKNELIDKVTELIVLMDTDLKNDFPSQAYGKFLRAAKSELLDYLEQITNLDNVSKPNYVALLLEVDKYVESYRGLVNIKGIGNKEQQASLLDLMGLLDDTKEAIDYNLREYVKTVVKSEYSKDLTEEELDAVMKEAYDIKSEDYNLGDLATSTDVLLAVADKIFKAGKNEYEDLYEKTISRINELGRKLLKASGLSKPDSSFYDFMKVFKNDKFTGRFVTRIGSQYYDKYYEVKNKITEKNGQRKQYIPILDIKTAKQEDIDYNIALYYDKKAYNDFMSAEILGPNGAEDGEYRKYNDTFKAIRLRYQQLVGIEKLDGTMYYKWEKRQEISDEQYKQFFLKYFNEVEYWGTERESDGDFHGRVSLKTSYFVKSEFVEIRDVASNGLDLRDAKYVKLMNPKTDLEKAQSEFYKGWVEEYQNQLEVLPPDVSNTMHSKVGRVNSAFFDKLKEKGSGFTKVVSKSLKQLFTADVYTNQRLVNELGEIDDGLPILYVGSLQNEGRVDFLNKELNALKLKKAQGKISHKDYLAERNKLKGYLKIEENKLKSSEIEGDLVKNLLVFAGMAEKYKVMSGIESKLQAIAKIAEERKYYETDSLGNKLISKSSKTAGKEGEAVVKRPEDVLATKRLKKWFQMVFYNNQEMDRSTFAMVTKRIQNLTSLKGVGFNIFGNFNNYVMGRINNSIEAAGGLYYDKTVANRAVLEYNKDYLPGVFKGLGDFSEGYYKDVKSYSKYEALVHMFRMVKKYQEDSGKVDIVKWGYLMTEGAEYNVQSKTGIAILMTKQLTNSKTGETLSIYDAFDFDPNTGKAFLKEGFELSDPDRYSITNYILEVNKQIHGNYAWEDRMVIQEHWLGQLAAQFHKWIYPAYKARFKERYLDANLGELEGRYRTVWNFLKYAKESEGNILEKLRDGWKGLDEIQVKNMYKNIAELAFFAASFALYGVFKALADGADDEDKTLKRWLHFLEFQQTRQMQEIVTLAPIPFGLKEKYQLAKSPIAILTTLKDFGEAIKATLDLPFPPYDKNYYEKGVYKGQLKAGKEWKDIIPAMNVLNKWEAFDQVSTFYIK
jgi:hypothetical protein